MRELCISSVILAMAVHIHVHNQEACIVITNIEIHEEDIKNLKLTYEPWYGYEVHS